MVNVAQLRIAAHRMLDFHWKEREELSRAEAYCRLAKEMGLPEDQCHIKQFDAEQCRQVIRLCQRW